MRPFFKQTFFCLCLAGFVLSLCGALPQEARASKYRWKIATLAPKGIGWAKQVEDFLYPVVEKVAGDDLELKIYWGGVMGDDEDFLRKMRIGQLQGAGFSGQGATLACPEFAVVELPFLFRNWEEVDYIRATMYPVFDEYFAKNGLKLQYWIDQDFDQMYSSKNAMATLEEMRECRFVTWYGPLEEALFQALGVDAVPLNVPEVAASIRSRVVDSDIGPAIWMVGAQMYTVVKYINPIKIRYSPAIITVTRKAWEEVPKNYRDRFAEYRVETETKFTQGTRRDNKKCLQAMYDYGVKETRMKPADLEAVKKLALTIYPELADKIYPAKLLEEVQRHLAAFRGKMPAAAEAEIKEEIKALEKAPVVEETVVEEVEAEVVEKASPTAEKETIPETPKPAAEKPQTEKPAAEALVPVEDSAKPALPAKAVKPAPPKKAAAKKPVKKATAWEKNLRRTKAVQARLKDLGYYTSTVDGIYGPNTFKSIVSFQKDNGLRPTGVIDAGLVRALGVD